MQNNIIIGYLFYLVYWYCIILCNNILDSNKI